MDPDQKHCLFSPATVNQYIHVQIYTALYCTDTLNKAVQTLGIAKLDNRAINTTNRMYVTIVNTDPEKLFRN
jgi:hypothetical protein